MKKNHKKYISEDKKAFIALLYIFSKSNFKKFDDIYYHNYVYIKAFINNIEIREFIYNPISLGEIEGEDYFTVWDASVNNYKQMCNDVIFDYKEGKYDFHRWKISTLHALSYSKSGSLINTDHDGWIGYEEYEGCGMSTGSRPLNLEKILPFLRPISSMTDEEKSQYNFYLTRIVCGYDAALLIDWLNSHHFDYRGLIKKGLAIEVTAENNPYK